MNRAFTLLVCGCVAALFAWGVSIDRLFSALQPMIVALSIIIAAIFVRLNRGMPALEWKSLDPAKRAELTKAVVDLSLEYAGIVAASAISSVLLISLAVIGEKDLKELPELYRNIGSGALGFAVSLSVIRMIYVIWRDVDVVRLQKELIDQTASDEIKKENQTQAVKISDEINASRVVTQKRPPPENWEGKQ